MRIAAFTLLLLAAAPARADRFIAYTDGRAGGCWLNEVGHMYGCTPQPTQRHNAPSARQRPTEDYEARRHVQQLERELDEVRAVQNAEQQRRNYEAAAEAQREYAEVEAYNREVEAHDARVRQELGRSDSARIQNLGKRTESCRDELARLGYTVVGPGACKKDGAYVNCPDC